MFVGTNEAAEGTNVVLLGTKLLDDALKGLQDRFMADLEGYDASSVGVDGSLHVDTSVEFAVDCA